MQLLSGSVQQQGKLLRGSERTSCSLPRSAVKPSVRGGSLVAAHAVQDTAAAGSDGESKAVRSGRRLFRNKPSDSDGRDAPAGSSSTSSTSTSSNSGPAGPAAAPVRRPPVVRRQQQPVSPPKDVLEDFAAAFEAIAAAPKGPPSKQYNRYSSDDADDDFSYIGSDPAPRSGYQGRGSGREIGRGGRGGKGGKGGSSDRLTSLFGRTSGSGSYGSIARTSGGGWGARGKSKGKDDPPTLEELEEIDAEQLSPQKQKLLEELKAEAAEAERKRLLRKERSERIPAAPRGSQDPIIFQAITRKWDEKMSKEELKGARAAARKVARVGLYDRNRALKAIRRKVTQKVDLADEEELTEQDKIIAQRAIQIREAAAAKSIQTPKEQLAQEAKGVPRSFDRAKALPEGLWDELINKYRAIDTTIKIGRRGATPGVVSGVQQAWRGHEVVKLRIHDDKSARKMNLPRINLLLRELEEMTGGVLLLAEGSSIWLYRGVDWTPPPPPPVYRPPPAEEFLQQQYTPLGTWQDMGGVTCYVTSSSSSSKGQQQEGSSSDSSSAGVQPAASDAMTVLMLPDHFSLADSSTLLQVADKFASKGALVVLADVLGAAPGEFHSNIAQQGAAAAGRKGTHYWPAHRWPLVKKRKLEYMEWYQTGPGSWQQQRPKLLQLLEAMQQQGLYDPDAGLVQPDPAASAAVGGGAEQQQDTEADAEASSSSSSSSQQQPTVTGRPLGLLGIGWGSFLGLHAAGDDAVVAAGAKVLVALSPATYNKDYDLSCKLQLPVALLPAKYDSMEQVMMFINLLAKPWELRCIFKRFGKVKPGWASWLPQWKDPRAIRSVAEQMLTAVSWLRRELLGVHDGYELPEPQLPATAGAASQTEVQAAAAKAEKKAAAELAEAEADAA